MQPDTQKMSAYLHRSMNIALIRCKRNTRSSKREKEMKNQIGAEFTKKQLKARDPFYQQSLKCSNPNVQVHRITLFRREGGDGEGGGWGNEKQENEARQNLPIQME
jgi:hypothetical protein